MIRHAASYPETLRPTDPLARAACAPHDPELWFPKNQTAPETAKAVKAKEICGRCSVRADCLAQALDRNEQHGIFGGLDDAERRALKRSAQKPTVVKADGQPERPRTLRALFEERTLRLPGGHIDWTACTSVTFKGANYTPRQIAFQLDRGYKPTGTVLTTCGHKGCVQALHLTDAEERGRCGTVTAYRRHVVKGEPVDDACQAVAPRAVAS